MELRSLSFRFHSMVLAGDTVGLMGEVTSATDDAAGTTVEARHQLMVGERRCSTARSIAWVPA